MELKSRVVPRQNDDSESEEEDRRPLLTAEEEATVNVIERIKESILKNLKYIRENKRKLAAAVMLWIDFLIASVAFSLLGPFFPQEVYFYVILVYNYELACGWEVFHGTA